MADALAALPERARLLHDLTTNEGTQLRLNALVGTRMGAAVLQPEGLVFESVRACVRPISNLTFNDEAFESYWDRLERQLFDDHRTATYLVPLMGLRYEGEAIQLGEGLHLSRLADDEVIRCLELGIITAPPGGPLGGFFASRPALCGLRFDWSEPTVVGEIDPGSLDTGPHPARRGAELATRAIQALRLFRSGGFRPIAHLQFVEFSGGTGFTLHPGGAIRGTGYELSSSDLEELGALQGALSVQAVVDDPALQNALRRFGFAAERHRPEDALVDLMIAAESLFLNDLDRREGELRFRMSLRAGWLLGIDRPTRLDICRMVRRAYDVRSDIVHGNVMSDNRLTGPHGRRGMDAFLEGIEELMRRALQQTVTTTARTGRRRTSSDWDELLSGEASSEQG